MSDDEDQNNTESLGVDTQEFVDLEDDDDDGLGSVITANTLPWAKLLDLGGASGTKDISTDSLIVGRKKSVVQYHIKSKMVSSQHFTIDRDADSESVTITDTSSNGTTVNGIPLVKGVATRLKSGDEITLCGKPNSTQPAVPKLVFHVSRKRAASPSADGETDAGAAAEATGAATSAAAAGAAAGAGAGGAAAASEPDAKKMKKVVDVEGHVQCTICMSVYHRPIVLIPCLHSYCSGCWSSWRKQSVSNNLVAECPECRAHCQRIQRNHAMQTLVDEFLEANPEAGRTDAELRELDAANTIDPRELDLPAAGGGGGGGGAAAAAGGGGGAGAGAAQFGYGPGGVRLPMGMFLPMGMGGGGSDDDATDDDDEDDDDDVIVTCPECPGRGPGLRSGHTCPADGSHERCLCCTTAMPQAPAAAPATRCAMCNTGPFCALYYDPAVGRCGVCTRFATVGTYPDLDRAQLCAGVGGHVCRVNRHERVIIFNYARDKSENVWEVCRDKWIAGEWTTASTPAPLDGNTAACRECIKNAFCELLYQYRENIPAAELPAIVAARPDCHWGFGCRTQHHRPHHAQNFNHICASSR